MIDVSHGHPALLLGCLWLASYIYHIFFHLTDFIKSGKLSQLILNIEDYKTGILNKSIVFSLPAEFWCW